MGLRRPSGSPRRRFALALAGGMLLAALPAGAHTLNPPASRVTSLVASASNGSVSVNGTATFGGQRLLSVGTDATGDTPAPYPAQLGYDLIEAKLGQLEASTGDLTFVFKLADLPPTGGLPEAARYIWDFEVHVPGRAPVMFTIDGKFTDVLRRQATRSPHFVLQSNCTTANNIVTCTDVANLTAEMISSENEIFVDVPRATLEQHVGASVAGAAIMPTTTLDGIIAVPSAYVSNATLADKLAQDPEVDIYTIGYKRVRVTATLAGGGTPTTVEGTLAANGTFSAGLEGLAPGTYTVATEACFAANCGLATTSVTV